MSYASEVSAIEGIGNTNAYVKKTSKSELRRVAIDSTHVTGYNVDNRTCVFVLAFTIWR